MTDTYSPEEIRRLHARWRSPEFNSNKSVFERTVLHVHNANGKKLTSLFRKAGIETEHPHPLVTEVERLRDLLVANGIDPA